MSLKAPKKWSQKCLPLHDDELIDILLPLYYAYTLYIYKTKYEGLKWCGCFDNSTIRSIVIFVFVTLKNSADSNLWREIKFEKEKQIIRSPVQK